jgi:hypothetical protein
MLPYLSEITDVHTHQIVAYVLSVYAIQYSLSGMNGTTGATLLD